MMQKLPGRIAVVLSIALLAGGAAAREIEETPTPAPAEEVKPAPKAEAGAPETKDEAEKPEVKAGTGTPETEAPAAKPDVPATVGEPETDPLTDMATPPAAPAPPAASVPAAEKDAAAPESVLWGFADLRYRNNSDSALWGGTLGGPAETPPPSGDTATFVLAEVELDLAGTAGAGGYRIDVEAFGGSGGLTTRIEQAYLSLDFMALNRENTLTVGQFNAPVGWGALDAPNMNTVSHSSVFTALLPTNLVGFMWQSALSKNIDGKLTVTNPWDAGEDTVSNAKTIGLHLEHRLPGLGAGLTWGASVLNGPARAGSDEDRLAYDAWFHWKILERGQGLIESLELVGELAGGSQTVEGTLPLLEQEHEWSGFRAELRLEFGQRLDPLGATLRLDRIEIEATNSAVPGATGHVLTGNLIDDGTLAGGRSGSVQGLTVAVDYRLRENVKLVAEYRTYAGDSVNLDPFGTEFHRDLFTLQLVVSYTLK